MPLTREILNKVTGTDVRLSVRRLISVQHEGAIVRIELVEVTARDQGRAIELAVVGDSIPVFRQALGAWGMVIPNPRQHLSGEDRVCYSLKHGIITPCGLRPPDPLRGFFGDGHRCKAQRKKTHKRTARRGHRADRARRRYRQRPGQGQRTRSSRRHTQ